MRLVVEMVVLVEVLVVVMVVVVEQSTQGSPITWDGSSRF